ncbi:unnamed protein product [Rotaria sp. Silwood2]|nr:unnamed protein product [Rotaria sp. Silwood2]CAF2929315.1 unnamed protein product [Rotaria sp. Silwood2]CAF3336090.1 unnamed protein product [Rotaria sp. Silwood2]CAF3905853.1 unnamed protein product [Rotaria sp. Silwood2]CAF4000202.1 unnamed protein product [Rotaria sp. Silwood2]
MNCYDRFRRRDSLTDLHDAVLKDSITQLERGLMSGVPPDIIDHAGQTALYYACKRGYTKLVEVLLKYGARHDVVDMNGQSPLWIAAKGGHETTVHILLKHGALSDQYANDRTTPLYQASYMGHFKCVLYLTEYDASVLLAKDSGASPIFVAARNGYHRIVKRLLRKGADPYQLQIDKRTPLQTALLYNRTRCVRLLLRKGKESTYTSDMYGWSPLHFSAKNGRMKAARVLFHHIYRNKGEKGLIEMRNTTDWVGNTALHIAIINQHIEFAQYLILKGFDVHQANNFNWTPFLLAIAIGAQNLVSNIMNTQDSSAHMVRGRDIAEQYRQYTILSLLNCSSAETFDLSETCSLPSDYLKPLLSLDRIGLIHYTAEEDVIRSEVETYVRELMHRVEEMNPLFRNHIICSGSYYEGTRVGQPDEFDFMINLTEIERLCKFEEHDNDPAGFGRLRPLTSNQSGKALESYMEPVTQCISSEKVRNKFYQCLTSVRAKVINEKSLSLFKHLKLEWTSGDKRCGTAIYAQWYGIQYASLKIKVDVIPCVTVHGWPRTSITVCPLAEPEFHTIARSTEPDKTYLWRISTSRAEIEYFQKVGVERKNAYVCLKILRGLIPFTCKIAELTYNADELLTSYMLKTEFFHEVARQQKTYRWHESQLIYRVLNILTRLLQDLGVGFIKSYYIKNYNVLDRDESGKLRSFEIQYVQSIVQEVKNKMKTHNSLRTLRRRKTISTGEHERTPSLRNRALSSIM